MSYEISVNVFLKSPNLFFSRKDLTVRVVLFELEKGIRSVVDICEFDVVDGVRRVSNIIVKIFNDARIIESCNFGTDIDFGKATTIRGKLIKVINSRIQDMININLEVL